MGSPFAQRRIVYFDNVRAPGPGRGTQIPVPGQVAMYLERERRGAIAFISMQNPMDMTIPAAIHRYGTLDVHGLQIGWDPGMVPDRGLWYLVCPNKATQRLCWKMRDTATDGPGFRMLFSVPTHTGAMHETLVSQIVKRTVPELIPHILQVDTVSVPPPQWEPNCGPLHCWKW